MKDEKTRKNVRNALWVALIISYILLIFVFTYFLELQGEVFLLCKAISKITYLSIPFVIIMFILVIINMYQDKKTEAGIKIPLLILTLPAVAVSVIFLISRLF